MITINQLNEAKQGEFTDQLKDIFEHSPWIPEKAWADKPFSSMEDLHEKMTQVIKRSTYEEKLKLIQAHPNLGTRIEMSESSVQEQTGAGLNQLSPDEYENFLQLNQQYMDKFSFPFIMAVKGQTKEEIYKAMEQRVNHESATEFETALSEIYKIALFRLKDLINKELKK
jgi:OHCU decarboxylase